MIFVHKKSVGISVLLGISIWLFFIFSGFSTFSGVALAETEVRGLVTHVRDGDTVKVGPIVIRLEGVSAPELKERMGKTAKLFMQDLVLNKRVTCRLNGKKTYDRFVGTCLLRGKDIGAIIISNGLALDCPRYSAGKYKSYETQPAKKHILLPKYCRLKKR